MKGGPKKTLSSPIKAVLVVGTTPDYVAKIYEKRPGSVVFLIDHHFEGDPHFNGIPPSALLFVALDDIEETYRRTTLFLSANDISPEGTACFDCESLITSSRLASRLQNIFPPWQAIARSRNKFAAGRLWSSAGVASSAAILASDTVRTLDFLDSHREGIVLAGLRERE